MNENRSAILVAIVGGSGAGKSWLATQLQSALGPKAIRLSLDDFYLDRSHLTPARRARINFDHPRAIDWPRLENVLRECASGRPAVHVPQYDFKTHCRIESDAVLHPGRLVIVEGLWLLRRPVVRRFFAFRVFIDCPARTRLRRRLERDARSRGRTEASIRRQFKTAVEPMHARFVVSQKRWANIVLRHHFKSREVRRIAEALRRRLEVPNAHSPFAATALAAGSEAT